MLNHVQLAALAFCIYQYMLFRGTRCIVLRYLAIKHMTVYICYTIDHHQCSPKMLSIALVYMYTYRYIH